VRACFYNFSQNGCTTSFGTTGVAFSEIKKIKDKEFWELICELSEQTKNALTNDPLKNLLTLEKAAIGIMKQLDTNNPKWTVVGSRNSYWFW
jgi:hypothetical protein